MTHIDLFSCATRLWNYNATNDNTYGDHWNGEDFSIFSLDSPQPSPRVSEGGFPVGGVKPSLRQEAPNFTKEVIRRAAAQHTGGDSTLKDDSASDATRGDNDDEEVATIMNDDSPFDRSYFCFDHESTHDDGPNHIEHIGGRALDAVVVSFCYMISEKLEP